MLLGDLIIWYYENLAGIKGDPDQPGFRHIIMNPLITGDLKFVDGSFLSPHGLIVSEWKKEGDILTMKVEIPANTNATIGFPTLKTASVTESGKQLQTNKAFKFEKIDTERSYFTVGSGSYIFKMSL